jgi:amidase
MLHAPSATLTRRRTGMQTTAGSYALIGALPARPAHVAYLLVKAGAVILGKANLAEWANFRGVVPSGWSARGGQCINAYVAHGDPGSSSSGSGVAAAAGLAAACVGTETDGSIVSPSRRNCVVGIKPTVGLTSRTGGTPFLFAREHALTRPPRTVVIPISSTQDSVGPIARCVADAALLLNAMAGPDPRDSASFVQSMPVPDYTARLTPDALRGARIGVPRALIPTHRSLDTPMDAFEQALETIRGLGAVVIDPAPMPSARVIAGERVGMLESERRVMEAEFRVCTGAVLLLYAGADVVAPRSRELRRTLRTCPTCRVACVRSRTSSRSTRRTLTESSSRRTTRRHGAHARCLSCLSSHSVDYWLARLVACTHSTIDDTYRVAIEENLRLGRTYGIDAALAKHNLDALVLPADGACRLSSVARAPSQYLRRRCQRTHQRSRRSQDIPSYLVRVPYSALY